MKYSIVTALREGGQLQAPHPLQVRARRQLQEVGARGGRGDPVREHLPPARLGQVFRPHPPGLHGEDGPGRVPRGLQEDGTEKWTSYLSKQTDSCRCWRAAAQQTCWLPEGGEKKAEEVEEAELVRPGRVRGARRDPRHPRVRAAAQDAGRGRAGEGPKAAPQNCRTGRSQPSKTINEPRHLADTQLR